MPTATLSIVKDERNNKFLMIKHERGINKGFVNFSGGKQEPDETLEQCVRRETLEETGITVLNPKKVGYVEFPSMNFYVHIFYSTEFTGEVSCRAGEIQKVFWQDADHIPYDLMREADRVFLPRVLNGENVKMRFNYDPDGALVSVEEL